MNVEQFARKLCVQHGQNPDEIIISIVPEVFGKEGHRRFKEVSGPRWHLREIEAHQILNAVAAAEEK